MISDERTSEVKSNPWIREKTLLIVGPFPPPVGGSAITVQEMIDELSRKNSIRVAFINTSPSRDPSIRMGGLRLEKIRRFIVIFSKYILQSQNSHSVLVFANNLFTFSLVPALLLWARFYHKPFFIKPVGGDLDLYLMGKRKFFRKCLLRVLRAADGILAQTKLLQATLNNFGCTNTHYLPGCRSVPCISELQKRNGDKLRLIFLAHINRDKGPLILLEALRLLGKKGSANIACDFYGPIEDATRQEFVAQLKSTPNARYCGIAEAGSGSQLIAGYDVLVLPTYFICEGHPGVIIEAMHAGVAVISTQHRSIPELVNDGENGILIPSRDSQALANAIMQLEKDRVLVNKMGKANFQKGKDYRINVVVERMLKIIFP
jgi:glycosyltransferase involved in cell wall biosynthesis